VAFHRAKNALTSVILFGAAISGCHSTQLPVSPAKPMTTAAPTTQSVAPPVRIQPLPVREVQKSQPAASDKCPVTNPNVPVAPTDVLITCDVVRSTLYTLGPETMQLVLAHVDAPKSLTSGFYEVNLMLDPSSALAWASFTEAHLHSHVAFIRDDLVLEAPTIESQVTSGQVALTTQTAEAADQLAQLAGRPE